MARPDSVRTGALSGVRRRDSGPAPSTKRCRAATAPGLGALRVTSRRAPPVGRLQLAAVSLGDDPAVVDDDDAVGQLVGLVEVLGGEQQRDAVGHERPG